MRKSGLISVQTAFCVVLALLGFAVSAYGSVTWAGSATFYSDATHTDVVGDKAYFCNGQIDGPGVTSDFYDITDVYSCTGPEYCEQGCLNAAETRMHCCD